MESEGIGYLQTSFRNAPGGALGRPGPVAVKLPASSLSCGVHTDGQPHVIALIGCGYGQATPRWRDCHMP